MSTVIKISSNYSIYIYIDFPGQSGFYQWPLEIGKQVWSQANMKCSKAQIDLWWFMYLYQAKKMGLNMVELVQVGPWPYLFDGTEKPTEHLSNRENQG